MSDEIVKIGRQIEAIRKELGLTQLQLAELAGISYRPIYLIEGGKSIRLETLAKISDALGCDLSLRTKGKMSSD